jgi:cell shape-determining protein MreC
VLGILVVLGAVRLVLPDAFTMFASPLWRTGAQGAASLGVADGFLIRTQDALRERDTLRAENQKLQEENTILVARSQDLQRVLGSRTSPAPGVVAGVLARPPVSPYDVLVLDQGSEDRVLVGAMVYGAGGTPLGTIASTGAHSSRALFYSAPGRETLAWVGSMRTPLTLAGQGSGAFYALISREAKVSVGDEVYVSGPGALPVGTVSSIDTDPAASKVKIHIRPLTNPFSITWVTISRTSEL